MGNDVPKKWDEPIKMKLEAKFKSELKVKKKRVIYCTILEMNHLRLLTKHKKGNFQQIKRTTKVLQHKYQVSYLGQCTFEHSSCIDNL